MTNVVMASFNRDVMQCLSNVGGIGVNPGGRQDPPYLRVVPPKNIITEATLCIVYTRHLLKITVLVVIQYKRKKKNSVLRSKVF